MKITIVEDQNILRDGKPDVITVMIDQQIGNLDDLLDIFGRLAKALGYYYNGQLEIVEDGHYEQVS